MEARELVADLVASGMKQTEIAERTGLRQGAISKVLTGKVDDVMSRTYRKLEALHAEVKRKRSKKVEAKKTVEAH